MRSLIFWDGMIISIILFIMELLKLILNNKYNNHVICI